MQPTRTLQVEIVRHVNGVGGETLEPGDIVDLPEQLARELLQAGIVRTPDDEDAPPAGPLVSGPHGTIENHAADIATRDPVAHPRASKRKK